MATSTLSLGQKMIPDEKIIDYSTEDNTLREVLFELSELANVTIAFQDLIIPVDSIVTLSVRKERLGKVIDYLIEDHNLKYKIVGNQIVILQDKYKKATVSSKKKSKNKATVTISGIVRDADTGEPLVGSNVYLYDYSEGVSSNEYGFYSFTLNKGLQRIYASYIGYENGIYEIPLTRDTTINMELKAYTRLSEVLITEKSLSPIKPIDQPEIASIDVLTIENILAKSSLGGIPDVMRLAYASTGVTTGADGFGGMSVRGGETNQNLVLFDGIPVYNAQHGFGLFSIFNSSVIKSAKLYKGTFPSRYSGRLSSVLDIRTREGSFRKFKGDVALGLFTGSASIEGPIIKEKASFLVSVRRTYVDPWIRNVTRAINNNNGSTSVHFFDFNGKLNFSLGDFSKLYISHYTGNDSFDTDLTSQDNIDPIFANTNQLFWDSGNTLTSLRWNARLSQKLFLNATAYRSKYSFISFDQDRIEEFESSNMLSFVDATFNAAFYRTQILDVASRVELDYVPNPTHHIKFGGGIINHKFSPGFISVNQSDSINPIQVPVTSNTLQNELIETDLNSNEYDIFVEDEIQVSKKVRLNVGYNHSVIVTGERSYHIPQPRILMSVGDEKSLFKISWGRMGQFLHTLTNTGLGVPVDVWIPSTDQIEPETSWIFSVGQFKQTKLLGNLGVELFYKKFNNLTRFSETGFINISADSNWENLVPIGQGESYGAEFSIKKETAKTNFELGYTLSWSNRQFDLINQGQQFAFRYDRRHVINIGLRRKLAENIDFSTSWEFGSGTPVTLPENRAFTDVGPNGEEIVVLIYSEINNSKLPAYHRLDVGVDIHSDYKWGTSTLTLGLYNAYNRQNPFYRDINFNPNGNPKLRFQDLVILPVLPSFRYAISF
ncbi:TonB-dependent receptor [Saprospiraceae bacterium]|nr:TonB-dependent receptor [Saprospiraceae bacterium]